MRGTSRPQRVFVLLLLLAGLGALKGFAPARAKEKAAPTQIGRPKFSSPGGVFTNAVTLSLTAATPAAEVRYTLDGSDPTLDSLRFTAPLLLTNSVMVRARALVPGKPPGPIAEESFLFLDPEILDFTSNLPLILIHSFGQEMIKERKLAVSARFIRAERGRAAVAGPAEFDGRMLMNLRGRASLRYAKRSYTIKLQDADEEPLKVPLLGLPKESDWVLYAPYPDKTLIRDVLAYDLSNAIGRWAPRTRLVELFLNESGGPLSRQDYLGVYVLVERIKRDKHRVPIEALAPDDVTEPAVTGGYIFKKDHSDHGDTAPLNPGATPAFVSMNTSRTGFPTGPGGFPGAADGFQPPFRGTVRSSSSSSSSSSSRPRPRGGVVTNYFGASIRRDPPSTTTRTVYRNDDDEFVEMVDEEEFRASFHSWRTNKFYYVEPEPDELTPVQRAWLQGYINRLEAALYGREFKDPIKGYAAYLDVDSFIDYHLLVEATKNVDGFRFSTFFHKDRGGKVKMGPLWDWNLSFGNCNGKQGYMPEWWLWPQLDDREYCWFRRLFEDPDFGQKYVDRWSQLRASALATSNVLARVDTLVGSLQEAQARNFQRWPILGLAVSPNWYVGDTYEEEIKWMKEWIVSRLAWIDKQFVPAPALVSAPGAPCALEAAQGTIYYTTDGSDPRASGGTMGPQAKRYEQPVQVGPARLIARAQDGKRWSAPLVLGRR